LTLCDDNGVVASSPDEPQVNAGHAEVVVSGPAVYRERMANWFNDVYFIIASQEAQVPR